MAQSMLEGLPLEQSREPTSSLFHNREGERALRPSLQLVQRSWKSAELGLIQEPSQFEPVLLRSGNRVNYWARHMFHHSEFVISPEGEVASFERVSVWDLGFVFTARIDQIFDRAWDKFSFEFCPGDASPILRQNYEDQPEGENFIVATQPLLLSNGKYVMPRISCFQGDRWLCGTLLDAHHEFPSDTQFIFRRRNQLAH
ncbi:MAG: hypothetical protein AAB519_02980 [Patescibacteria group bacterium]